MDENPKRRWFRFRLSTVLILTAIAGWGMACRPIWNHRYEEGRSLKYRGLYHPEMPNEAMIVRRSTHSFRPAFTPHGLAVDVCDWQVDEKRLNQRLICPALALAGFLAWKSAWAIGLRARRRRSLARFAVISVSATLSTLVGGMTNSRAIEPHSTLHYVRSLHFQTQRIDPRSAMLYLRRPDPETQRSALRDLTDRRAIEQIDFDTAALIVQLLNHSTLCSDAMPIVYQLAALAPQRLPASTVDALLKVVENSLDYDRGLAISALGLLGRDATRCEAPLRSIAQSTDEVSPRSRLLALAALTRLFPEKQDSLDKLAAALTENDSSVRYLTLAVLAGLGPKARRAAPQIRLRLIDTDPAVRVMAANATWKTTGETQDAVSLCIAALSEADVRVWSGGNPRYDTGTSHRVVAAQLLGEMGVTEDRVLTALKHVALDRQNQSMLTVAGQSFKRLQELRSKQGRETFAPK